jgi:Na+-driven multidrug efflux pump
MSVVGLQRYMVLLTTVGLLLNVAMNFLLIPIFGGLGAAIATLVSYFFSGYVLYLFLPALREIGIMQTRAFWPWARLYSHLLGWR